MNELRVPIQGQERAINTLNHLLQNPGALSHAYLFSGAAGLGKMQTAKAFARAILAPFPGEHHPDLLVLERQEVMVRIAEVRRLWEWLSYKPYLGQRRVAIVPEAHMMTLEAGNALLKTLEEPPEGAVIILVADQDTLLPTIVSRCQEIRFVPLTPEAVARILIEQGFELERAKLAAALSEGSPGRGISLAAENPFALLDKVSFFMTSLCHGDSTCLFETADALEKERKFGEAFIIMMEAILRDALLVVSGLSERALLPQAPPEGLVRLGRPALHKMVKVVNNARLQLNSNVNFLVLYTSLFLNMAQIIKEVKECQ